MHHTTDMTTHTTAFVTPVVKHWLERELDVVGICPSVSLTIEKMNARKVYYKLNVLSPIPQKQIIHSITSSIYMAES